MLDDLNNDKFVRDLLQKELKPEQRKYAIEAYLALMNSLLALIASNKKTRREQLSVKELLDSFAAYVLEEYGPFSKTVLEKWGVHSTNDLGHIAMTLANLQLMVLDEEDTQEKFDNVFDFIEVFSKPFFCKPPFPDLGDILKTNLIQ